MAGPYVTTSGSGFPQTSANRTRLQAATELSQYVGGEGRGDALARAASAWDGAVRYFNSVAWKFNRVTQDLLLDSTMLDNTAAPTLARDAGSGTGFTLTSGTSIDYWVEERVKDAGGTIIKRNFAPAATVVTLVGDGTNDKPVLTRPATKSADTTHWALYGTAAGGKYPFGVFLSEVAIATTTIEDTRIGNDPAIIGSPPVLYEPSDFGLLTDFRSHKRAWLVDLNGLERFSLDYQPWEQFPSVFEWRLARSTTPEVYTVRNPHQEGSVILFPRLRLPASWPILRLEYHRWIALATSDSDRLNVPRDVDEAIFERATATILSRVRSFADAQAAFVIANDTFLDAQQHYRDWPDF